ncbi:glycosyltransferase family 2 protein [Leucobacter komagatae]|uniref:glycosyltransferase family 2 protein n=1 Tax=Leucobacter komagatae TaxID=55969 RepID=UPI0009FFDD0F
MATIEIIIPVHAATRPVERAVASVLADGVPEVSAVVVCHNLSRAEVAARLGRLAALPSVRFEELHDGSDTPAAPRNYAIFRSTADYVGFLDSDDELQPGAMAGWAAELGGSPDVLVGQLHVEGAGRMLAPLPRLGHFDRLDPVRDLLNDRTTLQGVLVKASVLHSPESPGYDESYRVGEDIAIGLYVWNCAKQIRYARTLPGYLLRNDASDRLTAERTEPKTLFDPLTSVVGHSTLAALSSRRRRAIAVKLLRRHVLGFLISRHRSGGNVESAFPAAGAVLDVLMAYGPGAIGYFQRGEARAIAAIRRGDEEAWNEAVSSMSSTPVWGKLVPLNPLRVLSPQAYLVRGRRSRRLAMYIESLIGGPSTLGPARS